MLNALGLGNFRGFKSLNIEFSQLNIFVGPNNAGKSSIISAINLIAQNVKRERFTSGLSLNGPYVDLGSYYDAIYEHKSNSNLKINFQINNNFFEYNFHYRIQRREIELFKSTISDESYKYQYELRKAGTTHNLSSVKSGKKIPLGKMRPRPFGLTFFYGGLHNASEMSPSENDTYRSLRSLLSKSDQHLDREFHNFDSIGSFRAPPQRTYVYSGESPNDVGRAGENAVEIIASSSSGRDKSLRVIMQRTSSWFVRAGIAQGLEIRPLTNRHFELMVTDRTGSANNIADAGYGCSQALPVIIGGYKLLGDADRVMNSMYVVQEPEIHLHPSAAAQMGSFFCQLAKYKTQCFVETHSDSLILRVARHVAMGHLNPQDVKIFWVSEVDGVRDVSPVEFRDDGSFVAPWPEGFFPTRSVETLELARAAAKLSTGGQLELALDD